MKEESGRQGNDQGQSEGKGGTWSWSDRSTSIWTYFPAPIPSPALALSLSPATQLGTQGLHRQHVALSVVGVLSKGTRYPWCPGEGIRALKTWYDLGTPANG